GAGAVRLAGLVVPSGQGSAHAGHGARVRSEEACRDLGKGPDHLLRGGAAHQARRLLPPRRAAQGRPGLRARTVHALLERLAGAEVVMRELVERLDALCDAAPFHASWYLKDVATGAHADRLGDVPVPSAGPRKVSIMMATIHRFGLPPKLPADHTLEQVTSTTPNDQGLLLELILKGTTDPAVAARLGSTPELCRLGLDILSWQKYKTRLPSLLPLGAK